MPSPQPVFTIQVVASSVLLRDAFMPEVQWLAAVSGRSAAGIAAADGLANQLGAASAAAHRADHRPHRARAVFIAAKNRKPMAKEFAAVESKLNVLGEQFRGAREEATAKQHNLDQLLERMASQLDVASRLAAISRITGGVAHEIKNPLNAISLRLDLLRARLGAAGGGTGPGDRYSVERSAASGSRGEDVSRFLAAGGCAAGGSGPGRRWLREVADLMTPQARLAGMEMQFEAAAGRRNVVDSRRRGYVEAGDAESGDQRARRDEDRRQPALAGVARGRFGGAGGGRQRSRHSAGAARQSFSAVLYNQSKGLRHRFGDDVPGGSVA